MFPSQTNTQVGDRPFVAAADLTGKEGLLTKLANSGGINQLAIIAALTDIPSFVLVDGGASGKPVTGRPLYAGHNVRARLYQTCVAGDDLVLADPTANAGAQAGMVRKLPATAGVYIGVGKAEETGVDGQLVLMRPHVRLIFVKSADSLTALTFTGGGATGAEVAALRDAVKTILEAQGLMA